MDFGLLLIFFLRLLLVAELGLFGSTVWYWLCKDSDVFIVLRIRDGVKLSHLMKRGDVVGGAPVILKRQLLLARGNSIVSSPALVLT